MASAEAIKNALNYESFYSKELGNLIPETGGNHKALCPFHEDTDPSLSLNLETGLFNCFGCDVGGDVFTFYQKKHGVNFKVAVEELARLAGVNGDRPQTGKPQIVAIYSYLDGAGNLAFQVVRKEPGKNGKKKDFQQRRPDGKGGWIWNLEGVPLVPYRLPEIIKASTVFIPEGEKDCDHLALLGLTPTTNAGGASKPGKKSKWWPEYNRHFQGKAVVILPDNDEPGRAHAHYVARNLHGVAAMVKVLQLPGLPPRGDVSDWLAAGGTKEKLLALVEEAPEWEPSEEPLPSQTITLQENLKSPATGGLNLTDLGNAKRLVVLHGQNIRYCYPWGKWLVWDSKRWARDETGELERLAKETVQEIYAEAAAIQDEKYRQAVAQHALRTESEGRRKAMVIGAQSEPGVPILPEQLDVNPWVLNLLNGTVDLKSGKLRSHDRADLITKLAPVRYDPHATCLNWINFLRRILPPPIVDFLQKAVGYSLTGITWEQVMFFLWGLGANGKSVLLKVLQSLLGDYAVQTTSDTFLAKPRGGGIPNDVAALKGSRFVAAVEVEAGRRMAESLVKQMTGGDQLAARFLHGEFFSFTPAFKVFLAANHKPVIKGTDHGIWRRIRLIPFTVQIPKEEQDRELPEKLMAELPGILNWALAGCLQWQYSSLAPPEEVIQATQDYREEMDVMADFLTDRCIIAPGGNCHGQRSLLSIQAVGGVSRGKPAFFADGFWFSPYRAWA